MIISLWKLKILSGAFFRKFRGAKSLHFYKLNGLQATFQFIHLGGAFHGIFWGVYFTLAIPYD